MKYCGKCGQQNQDNTAFCSSCGNKLFDSGQSNNEQNNPADIRNTGLLSPNPVINTLKKAGSSGLFLTAVILFTVSVLLSFVNALLPDKFDFNRIVNEYPEIFDEIELSNEIIDSVQDIINVFTTAGALVMLIPTILIGIGMWLFYTASRSRDYGPMSTTGLTMIKVLTIINLVGLLLLPVVLTVLMAVGASAASEMDEGSVLIGIYIAMVIIFAIALVLPVLYFVFIIKTINEVKRTATAAVPSDKISGFVAVANYIIGGFLILSALSSDNVLPVLTNLVSGAFYIIMGIALFGYKKQMRMLKYSQYMSDTSYSTQI